MKLQHNLPPFKTTERSVMPFIICYSLKQLKLYRLNDRNRVFPRQSIIHITDVYRQIYTVFRSVGIDFAVRTPHKGQSWNMYTTRRDATRYLATVLQCKCVVNKELGQHFLYNNRLMLSDIRYTLLSTHFMKLTLCVDRNNFLT